MQEVQTNGWCTVSVEDSIAHNCMKMIPAINEWEAQILEREKYVQY